MDHFELVSEYAPTGDQPQAIEALVDGFKKNNKFQTLLGVTGSGKTFTMANNAVEYFVSYYDYYQPEAYVPSTDTYIAKDSAVNDEIDRLRHSATAALSELDDVIIV